MSTDGSIHHWILHIYKYTQLSKFCFNLKKKTCFCGFWLMFPKTEQDLPSFNHAYFYYKFDLIIHSLWASYIPTFNKRNIFFQTNYIQLTKNWIQMRVVFVNKKKTRFQKTLMWHGIFNRLLVANISPNTYIYLLV